MIIGCESVDGKRWVKRREIVQLDRVTTANDVNRASTQARDLLSLHTYFVNVQICSN